MKPMFRAKSKITDLYELGYIFKSQNGSFIIPICEYNEKIEETDFIRVFEPVFEDTISIHFPNMLDSNENKIFASLQEDGKGGDIMQDDEYFGIAKYKDCELVVEYENCIDNIDNGNFDVVGIKE